MLLSSASDAFSDITLIKNYLTKLTKTNTPRSFENISQLNAVASYIESIFSIYADSVQNQEYKVQSTTYKNIICSFGTENKKRIFIGADYDACGNQQGADDNATGIAGLLELARIRKGQKLQYRIDLVTYILEEPPFFRTEHIALSKRHLF